MTFHTINLHSRLERSVANGPGCRAVVWLQGCSLGCRGCFNARLKDPAGGESVAVEDLFRWLADIRGVTGLSVSGGEPTDQLLPLTEFLSLVRERSSLSILLFSGRTLEQMRGLGGGPRLLSLLDVLVDGPYDPQRANPPGVWPSSSNQKLRFFTSRYGAEDFARLPVCEAVVNDLGQVVWTGLGGFPCEVEGV